MDAASATPTSATNPISAAEFAELFRASFRVLWLIAAGMLTNKSLADDIVQDAAITAFGKREQFTPGTSFTAWMGQMVRFTAMNLIRKEKRQAAGGAENEVLEAGGAGGTDQPEPTAVGHELRLTATYELPDDQEHFDDDVINALNEVTPEARACLLLRVIEELDYAQIALILDMPEGTAMSHVHRTKKFLRQKLANAS